MLLEQHANGKHLLKPSTTESAKSNVVLQRESLAASVTSRRGLVCHSVERCRAGADVTL